MKRFLFAFVALLSAPAFVAAQCITDQHLYASSSDYTTAFQTAVDTAALNGCSVFLDRGPNGQDTYVLSQTIVLPGNVTITKWPDAPGTITIQAGTNIDPDTTTTFCAHPGNPGTRNVFCSSGKDAITIADLNFVPFSGQTVVKNPPDNSSGREVWAVKNGGSNLIFRDNTVSNFTDGLFVELDGTTGSNISFLNNGVNLTDRYPLCSGGMPCGGNAAFTVVNCASSGCPGTPADQSTVEFNGNTVVGPGSSIPRPAAVVGGIVFDDNSTITGVEMKNNRVTQSDHGLFIAATCLVSTDICNKVSGNSGLNNGNGLTVSRGGALPIGVLYSCSPGSPNLPASGISITKNTFNSNGYDGGCIAAPTGSGPFIVTNNIFNGNQNQCLENYSGSGPSGSSPANNICRGPGNNSKPPSPPGKGVKPGGH